MLLARIDETRTCTYGRVYPSLLAQAFRTVGKSFTPIAQNTTGVIVPYAGCDEELQKLFAAKDAKEKSRYYRRLQKFTVNVYENKLSELQEYCAITFYEKHGIWVLNSKFYNDETGISLSQVNKTDNYIL